MPSRNKARPRIQMPIAEGTATHDMDNGNHLHPTASIHAPGSSIYPMIPLSNSLGNLPLGSILTPAPRTPGVIIPGTAAIPGGVCDYYPNKASGFVFKQFRDVKHFTLNTAKSGLSVGEKTAVWLYEKISKWSKRWFTHLFLFLVVFAYSVLGAFLFRAIEGPHENKHRTDIFKAKVNAIQELHWVASNGTWKDEERFILIATKIINEFQNQVYLSYSEAAYIDKPKEVWDFWNALFYCGTIYTTIGYGHIAPSTNTGRAVTIVYAIFGIPLFLILLADFGKMFTRAMKFLWAFVRRLYYTGSCRKVRHTGPVQEVMKGVQMVYDIARFQRSPGSAAAGRAVPQDEEDMVGTEGSKSIQAQQETSLLQGGQEPPTPAPSNFCVDDEFNLPISVAIAILVGYIFVGATLYCMWEEWSFFEAFYFVFISMSTIGFGDYVPKFNQMEARGNSTAPRMQSSGIFSMYGLQHPMFMMGSIVYLVFGLALTSMCINVVQVKLSDTFRQASSKIGASLGLRIAAAAAAEEEATRAAMATNTVELADVHTTAKKASEENLDGLSLEDEETLHN